MRQFCDQLGEAYRWIDDDRLHGGQLLESLVNSNGVKDPERLLFDLITQASGAAKHLIEKDTAIYPAQENEVTNLWHVHASSEQVYCDRNIGFRSFLKRRINCKGLSAAPVILMTASSSTVP